MRENAEAERRMIYLCVDLITKRNPKFPCRKKDLRAALGARIDEAGLEQALQWLNRAGLIFTTGISQGWRIEEKTNPDKLCWTHGLDLPCRICAHVEKRRKCGRSRGGRHNEQDCGDERVTDFSAAVFSDHALEQMVRRGITEEQARAVLAAPRKVAPDREGRVVAQGFTGGLDAAPPYLLRVFVDVDREPPVVVTVYKTSKIEKYGSTT